MKKYIEIPIVVGVSAALVVGEAFAGESLPHGEFIAVSPSPMMNIAIGNAAASTVSMTSFDIFTPVEVKIPHDHLVVYPSGLVHGKR